MNDPRTQVLPTLHAYWHLLDNADWHYEMSDDPSCWRAGRDQFVTIGALARLGGEHRQPRSASAAGPVVFGTLFQIHA